MNTNIRDYMRVGIVHFMAYPQTMKGEGPILETVRSIATDPYFDAVELTWIKDDEVRQQVKDELSTAKMSVAYGGQPRLLTTKSNINDLDEAKRKEALQLLLDGIDEAYEIGAEGFAFLSGPFDLAKKEEAYEALVDSTRTLCQHAQSKGNMKVVLEVFDDSIDKKSLIGPAPLAKRFAKDIRADHENFGLMVDLSHIPMLHETIAEHVMPLKDYIVHAHMGNTVIRDASLPAYGDLHPRFGFPGSENDVEELAAYLQLLKDIEFIGPASRPIVSFEVKPWQDESSEMVLANAKRTLDAAWRIVR